MANKPPFAQLPGQPLLNPAQQNQLVQSFKNKGGIASGSVGWQDIKNKPSSFPVSAHTHSEAEIINLIKDISNLNVVFNLATVLQAGIVKVGSGLSIADDGTLSVPGGIGRVNNIVPAGVVDGTNTVFTLPITPIDGSEEIFVGTGKVFPGSDYNISNTVITFINSSQPTSLDTIHASYFYVAVTGNRVNNIIPSGVVDGVNTIFVLPSSPLLGTEEVFVGVGRVFPGVDYNISGSVITFINSTQPTSTDSIHASYFYSVVMGNRVNNEIPVGVIDGVNTVFYLYQIPVPNTEEIFVGVGKVFPGVDYTVSNNIIVFINGTQPQLGGSLHASYFI